jgi:transcription factor SPN1
MQYTVAPESQTLHRKEDKALVDRIRSDNAKFNKFARQMKAKK